MGYKDFFVENRSTSSRENVLVSILVPFHSGEVARQRPNPVQELSSNYSVYFPNSANAAGTTGEYILHNTSWSEFGDPWHADPDGWGGYIRYARADVFINELPSGEISGEIRLNQNNDPGFNNSSASRSAFQAGNLHVIAQYVKRDINTGALIDRYETELCPFSTSVGGNLYPLDSNHVDSFVEGGRHIYKSETWMGNETHRLGQWAEVNHTVNRGRVVQGFCHTRAWFETYAYTDYADFTIGFFNDKMNNPIRSGPGGLESQYPIDISGEFYVRFSGEGALNAYAVPWFENTYQIETGISGDLSYWKLPIEHIGDQQGWSFKGTVAFDNYSTASGQAIHHTWGLPSYNTWYEVKGIEVPFPESIYDNFIYAQGVLNDRTFSNVTGHQFDPWEGIETGSEQYEPDKSGGQQRFGRFPIIVMAALINHNVKSVDRAIIKWMRDTSARRTQLYGLKFVRPTFLPNGIGTQRGDRFPYQQPADYVHMGDGGVLDGFSARGCGRHLSYSPTDIQNKGPQDNHDWAGYNAQHHGVRPLMFAAILTGDTFFRDMAVHWAHHAACMKGYVGMLHRGNSVQLSSLGYDAHRAEARPSSMIYAGRKLIGSGNTVRPEFVVERALLKDAIQQRVVVMSHGIQGWEPSASAELRRNVRAWSSQYIEMIGQFADRNVHQGPLRQLPHGQNGSVPDYKPNQFGYNQAGYGAYSPDRWDPAVPAWIPQRGAYREAWQEGLQITYYTLYWLEWGDERVLRTAREIAQDNAVWGWYVPPYPESQWTRIQGADTTPGGMKDFGSEDNSGVQRNGIYAGQTFVFDVGDFPPRGDTRHPNSPGDYYFRFHADGGRLFQWSHAGAKCYSVLFPPTDPYWVHYYRRGEEVVRAKEFSHPDVIPNERDLNFLLGGGPGSSTLFYYEASQYMCGDWDQIPGGGSPGTSVGSANFTASPRQGNPPLTVQFTDLSSNSPVEWYWDFDNNGTFDSTDQNPAHTYTSPGNYTVRLRTVDANGLASELIRNNYISVNLPPGPVADFTASPLVGTAPLAVTFRDNSQGDNVFWQWDFQNDGQIDRANSVNTWIYATPGTYSVWLRVTDRYNRQDTIVKQNYITVNPPTVVLAPDADFVAVPRTGFAPLDIQFTDRSRNTPTSWAWDFSGETILLEGNTLTGSTEQNPVHTYSESGVFSPTLIARNEAGYDSVTKYGHITIYEPSVDPPSVRFISRDTRLPYPNIFYLEDSSTGTTSGQWSIETSQSAITTLTGDKVAFLYSSLRPGGYDVAYTGYSTTSQVAGSQRRSDYIKTINVGDWSPSAASAVSVYRYNVDSEPASRDVLYNEAPVFKAYTIDNLNQSTSHTGIFLVTNESQHTKGIISIDITKDKRRIVDSSHLVMFLDSFSGSSDMVVDLYYIPWGLDNPSWEFMSGDVRWIRGGASGQGYDRAEEPFSTIVLGEDETAPNRVEVDLSLLMDRNVNTTQFSILLDPEIERSDDETVLSSRTGNAIMDHSMALFTKHRRLEPRTITGSMATIKQLNPNTQYGNQLSIYKLADGTDAHKGIVQFDLNTIFTGNNDSAARIDLLIPLQYYLNRDMEIYARRILQPVDITGVTWSGYSGSSYWSTAGAEGLGTDVVNAVIDPYGLPEVTGDQSGRFGSFPFSVGYAQFNVTTAVNAILDGTGNRYANFLIDTPGSPANDSISGSISGPFYPELSVYNIFSSPGGPEPTGSIPYSDTEFNIIPSVNGVFQSGADISGFLFSVTGDPQGGRLIEVYQKYFIRNNLSSTAFGVSIWAQSMRDYHISMANERIVNDVIVDQYIMPSGYSDADFMSIRSSDDLLLLGDLYSGQYTGFWIRYTIPPGSRPEEQVYINPIVNYSTLAQLEE